MVKKLNNANLKIGVNNDSSGALHTITQDLREVKRGIELINKGASINVNGVRQTEQSLRSLEKTLEDTLKSIKANSFNSIVSEMAKIQEAAIKDNNHVDNLIKKYNRLDDVIRRTFENHQAMSESTYCVSPAPAGMIPARILYPARSCSETRTCGDDP